MKKEIVRAKRSRAQVETGIWLPVLVETITPPRRPHSPPDWSTKKFTRFVERAKGSFRRQTEACADFGETKDAKTKQNEKVEIV